MDTGNLNIISKLTSPATDKLQDNIMLNAFRIAINGSLTQFNMIDGIVDEYEDESGIDTVNSVNELYNSTDDYYSPDTQLPTGGTITTDGLYTVHTFTEDGTFTPPKSGNVEYLVVAGGAGGGSATAGGGGAGGFRTATGFGVTAQAYSITVGDGGAGVPTSATNGLDGEDSVFSTITSIGGGGGASQGHDPANDGGSGGGGAWNGGAGGSGTVGQGNDGGDNTFTYGGGGGGGAGAIGQDTPQVNDGGDGGAGLSSTIYDGSTIWYGGGGGGCGEPGVEGQGGVGGGGNGASGFNTGGNGTVNTGGGGGGTRQNAQSGNGGSGIVIIRYLTSDLALGSMTLISESFTAEAVPDTGRIVMLEEDVDSITLNTDLLAYASRDGGASWVQGTLSDEGDYDASRQILVADFDFTASGIGSGTDMEYKLVTTKNLKIHGSALSWD